MGNPDAAVTRAITVLVIACPHALGLAIPLVVSIATERAARGGVLVTDRLALERMRTVDAVIFDKTGTLTRGEPVVIGGLALADEIRPESGDAVAALHELGIGVLMITGDAEAVAVAVGKELGIDRVFAGVRTEDKAAQVHSLQKAGKKVAMTQNLWWAAGYNLISVPLAAGVLAPIGFVLPMSVGAVLMSLSTIIVALNAQLLRRLDLDPVAR